MKSLISVSLEKFGHYNGCKKDYSKNYNYINTTQIGTRIILISRYDNPQKAFSIRYEVH